MARALPRIEFHLWFKFAQIPSSYFSRAFLTSPALLERKNLLNQPNPTEPYGR